jgi:hypothetical protein
MRIITVTTESALIVPGGRGRQCYERGGLSLELSGPAGVQGNTWHML